MHNTKSTQDTKTYTEIDFYAFIKFQTMQITNSLNSLLVLLLVCYLSYGLAVCPHAHDWCSHAIVYLSRQQTLDERGAALTFFSANRRRSASSRSGRIRAAAAQKRLAQMWMRHHLYPHTKTTQVTHVYDNQK